MGIQLKKANGDSLYPLVNSSDITWNSDIDLNYHSITNAKLLGTNDKHIAEIHARYSFFDFWGQQDSNPDGTSYVTNIFISCDGSDLKSYEQAMNRMLLILNAKLQAKQAYTRTLVVGAASLAGYDNYTFIGDFRTYGGVNSIPENCCFFVFGWGSVSIVSSSGSTMRIKYLT